ncbi:unnamed protein product [Peronospora farinosa]|nr:unnamed protein product [Peronospora farinosa]
MNEYWPLIFQLLDIRMEDLPSASPWRGAEEIEIQPQKELECTFTKRSTVPFTFAKGVLNKHVVVSRILDLDMPSTNKNGSDENHDSRLTENWKRVPVGSSVLALNGLSCSKLTVEELRGLLETLPLPFMIRFSLYPESPTKSWRQQMKPQPEFTTFIFRQKGPFGLRLRARPLASCGVIIVGFTANSDGKKCSAELSDKIRVGQLLTKVNNVDLRFKTLSEVLVILHDLKSRPVTMQFATSPDAIIKLRDWPPMIETEDASSFTCDEDDPSSNDRHPDYTSFADIMEALRVIVSKKEPMRAVFVSPEHYVAMQKEFQQRRLVYNKIVDQLNEGDQKNEECDESTKESKVPDAVDFTATTTTTGNACDILRKTLMKEIVFPKAPLGILFGNWKDEAVCIRAFVSSPGPAEKSGLLRIGHAILQVCGHAVPREATPGIIEEMIMKVSAEERAQDSSSADGTTAMKSAEKKPKYTLTVRNLELERELMK